MIRQDDLVECLSLKLLYEQKRDAIAAAVKAGAAVEPGVHSVHMNPKLVIR